MCKMRPAVLAARITRAFGGTALLRWWRVPGRRMGSVFDPSSCQGDVGWDPFTSH